MAESLSQNKNVAYLLSISKSRNNCLNHIISQAVEAIALYSALAEERDIVACFLDFHETKESPRKMQNPVIDLLESKHLPQSTSQNALNLKLDLADKKIPWPRFCFKYFKRWHAAW